MTPEFQTRASNLHNNLVTLLSLSHSHTTPGHRHSTFRGGNKLVVPKLGFFGGGGAGGGTMHHVPKRQN